MTSTSMSPSEVTGQENVVSQAEAARPADPASPADPTRPADLAHTVAADPDLEELLLDVFTGYRERRGASEAGESATVELDRDLWTQLDELGLTRLSASEDSGGSGASWLEAAALLAAAATAAAPVPLAEHDVLAAWLLERAGLPNDGAIRTVCRPDDAGVAGGVLWASAVDGIVALWHDGDRWRVADIPTGHCEITPCRNVAGEPCDTVRFDLAELRAGAVVPDDVAEQFVLRGALARCTQMVGGMERAVEIVLTHVGERIQFGRPLAKLQAVQHLVADMAAETAAARAATDAAVARAATSDWADPGMSFAVAVAKSTAGHAASVVVRGAHQALGAIGTTIEHELHTVTKPVLARRGDFGSVHEWDSRLAEMAAAAGRNGLWPLILTGSN